MKIPPSVANASPTQTALFAGGCFWCTDSLFNNLDGVISARSGYAGEGPAPTYEQVSSGRTQFLEATEVTYDPSQITYAELLDWFWKNIDPTDAGGQFADRGPQYQTAVFYSNAEEKKIAEESREALGQRLGTPIATAVRPRVPFHEAEDYHQDYSKKNPLRYQMYYEGSGRPQRLKELHK